MVDPEFSERQFEYGLTAELEGTSPGHGLIDDPIFPTQNEEAYLPVDVLAWFMDVDISASNNLQLAPLFLQYKVSEKLTRSWTDEWQKLDRVHGVADHYFRFDIYLGDNNQHNKLVQIGKEMPLTFYAAPAFVSQDKYLQYRHAEKLYRHSAFIQCGQLSTVDHGDHVIAYTFPNPDGIVLSEPEPITVRDAREELLSENELEESFVQFSELQGQFRNLRRRVAFGPNGEGWSEDYNDPDDYDDDNLLRWILQQKQFFREVVDAEVVFIARGYRK